MWCAARGGINAHRCDCSARGCLLGSLPLPADHHDIGTLTLTLICFGTEKNKKEQNCQKHECADHNFDHSILSKRHMWQCSGASLCWYVIPFLKSHVPCKARGKVCQTHDVLITCLIALCCLNKIRGSLDVSFYWVFIS